VGRKHVRGEAGLRFRDVFVESSYEVGLDHNVASCPREETSVSRSSRTHVWAGQVRMACWKDSGPVSHRRRVWSGLSSNHEGWAAR